MEIFWPQCLAQLMAMMDYWTGRKLGAFTHPAPAPDTERQQKGSPRQRDLSLPSAVTMTFQMLISTIKESSDQIRYHCAKFFCTKYCV